MIPRREFITLLGGAGAVWPLVARAQQAAVPVVGFLRTTVAVGSAHLVGAFRQGLNEAGFVEGQNVIVEYRWADDQDSRIPDMAAGLVRRQVSVIVANGLAVPALKAATATIPIVFTTGFDPVRTGLVTGFSRPGGNATGIVFTQTDLAAKQLGLLHELTPKATTIAVLGDPNQPEFEFEARELESAARVISRQILILTAANERKLSAAFEQVVQARADALLVRGSSLFLTWRRQLGRWQSATHWPPPILRAITSSSAGYFVPQLLVHRQHPLLWQTDRAPTARTARFRAPRWPARRSANYLRRRPKRTRRK